MKYPRHLLQLIAELKKLPGVGHKSAERFAFHLLTRSNGELHSMAETIRKTNDVIKKCQECGCLSEEERCSLCDQSQRDGSVLCIVASPRDAFSIEQTHEFKGVYHVLDGVLNPLEGKGPEQLAVGKLLHRLEKGAIKEVIIALDSTLEGDATALYLKQQLGPYQVEVSRLAFGLPMGSSLDYVDGGTLARAFSGRSGF